MKFEKIINIKPPYDKRSSEPGKNYGIGSMQIWFILKKGEKAVQVSISTNSYLQSTIKEYRTTHPTSMVDDFGDYEGYNCWDVGYHSNTPMYKGQTDMDCGLLKNKKCYYDGSGLRGKDDRVAENFLKYGTDWVWKYLEDEWNIVFGK
jgi:hypothetical protein